MARTKTTRTRFTTYRSCSIAQEAMRRGAPQCYVGENADGTYHISVAGDSHTYLTVEAFKAVYAC